MQERYREMLFELSSYITFLEEMLLNYESKLKDMELDDMIEKYPGKSKWYYNRQVEKESESRNVSEETTQVDHKQWAYSKTEGDSEKNLREALAKAMARSEIEKSLVND